MKIITILSFLFFSCEMAFAQLINVNVEVTLDREELKQLVQEILNEIQLEQPPTDPGIGDDTNDGGGGSDIILNDFPIDLTGIDNVPSESHVAIQVTKKENATKAEARFLIHDPDVKDEGELYINDNGPIVLFSDTTVGDGSNADRLWNFDSQTVEVIVDIPLDWLKEGENILRFRHLSTGGFKVESGYIETIVETSNTEPNKKVIILGWEAPTLNEDGSKLHDLAGYRLYIFNGEAATDCKQADSQIDVGNVLETEINLGPGNYIIWVSAYDVNGNESVCSSPVEITL